MHVATLDELKEIERAFRAYPDVFPFIRRDFLQREIAAGRMLHDHGIVAIVKQMKRPQRYGTWRCSAGMWNMPELVKTSAATGMSAYVFFRKVLDEYVGDQVLFGTVRDDNSQSVLWHQAMGYTRVGDIVWSHGTLPGGVWAYDNRKGLGRRRRERAERGALLDVVRVAIAQIDQRIVDVPKIGGK